MLGVTLSENTPGSIKCPYFDTIISTTLKKVKRFQTGKIDVFFRNVDPQNSTRLNRKTCDSKENSLWLEFALFEI